MTQSRLDDFSTAYRAAHSDQLNAPAVLRRIRGTLRANHERRLQRRWVKWAWGMGVTTVLGASLAYAAPVTRALLQWVDGPSLGSSAADAHTNPAATTSMPGLPAPVLSVSHSAISTPSLPPHLAGAMHETRSSRSAAIVQHPRRAKKIDGKQRAAALDGPQETFSLYEQAQRLQVVEHDYAAALTAWDDYLATAKDSPLRADARYNHAVCLVHLRRYTQARVELARLTHPTSPAAYRSRAATLLHSLRTLSK